ncbi:MAG: DUF5011 domain-containing protein [Lachnospiraceae bacterium]|nr:DUF5011 domain-containing protein [Lachnospiraceae bacterium]
MGMLREQTEAGDRLNYPYEDSYEDLYTAPYENQYEDPYEDSYYDPYEDQEFLERQRKRRERRKREEARRRRRLRLLAAGGVCVVCAVVAVICSLQFGDRISVLKDSDAVTGGQVTGSQSTGNETVGSQTAGDGTVGMQNQSAVDEEAPEISGVVPLSAFVGTEVSYTANIVVMDDSDPEAELSVDTSAVDSDEAGTYDITYTATDKAGHTASASTTITFSEKPEDYIEESVVLEEAQAVLDEILSDDMTLKQKTRAIYTWVRAHLSYSDADYDESWTNGAHIGFTTGTGDGFIYFSTTKALLTQAGVPNIDVEKSNVTSSRHYWSLVNVGDGWYHLDTTPRLSGATFFLATDAEMTAYFEEYGAYDAIDTSRYPATPTTASTIE